MTDLLERLRAVNPVPTCDPPIGDDVWRRLDQETRKPNASRAPRFGVRHAGLGLGVAVPLVVAALAIVLLGHGRSQQQAPRTRPLPAAHDMRPAHHRRRSTHSSVPSSSLIAALARGQHPLAPDAGMRLPILGSAGTRTLRSFRGELVVLNVFASWCELCAKEATTLEYAQRHILGRRGTVLGVTYLDREPSAEAFVRAHRITYPVVRDVTGRFVRSFYGGAVPETFVIDPRGRIVAAYVGPVSRQWLIQILAPACFPPAAPTAAPAAGAPSACRPNLPPAASELAAMARAYPLLARVQRPTDIPAAGLLDDSDVVSRGGLLANSRRAMVTARGESLYIVPADHAICVTSSDNVVEGCQVFPYTSTTPADISATICAPKLPPTELEVAGLMPPDASHIKVHYSNGSTRPITAINGIIAIYARIKGAVPMSITWTSPSGPQSTGTAVPTNVASTKCAS